jgi:hypothetical protein
MAAWTDQTMFLSELDDELTVHCKQLNVEPSALWEEQKKADAVETEPKTSGYNPNPKKVKKGKKGKKKMVVQSESDKENTSSTNPLLTMRSQPPAARGGSTMTFIPSTRQLIVVGGANRSGKEFGFRYIGKLSNALSKKIKKKSAFYI